MVDYAADAYGDIAKRMREIAQERRGSVERVGDGVASGGKWGIWHSGNGLSGAAFVGETVTGGWHLTNSLRPNALLFDSKEAAAVAIQNHVFKGWNYSDCTPKEYV